MPTYVYRNLVTQATFEVKQRITDAALTHDPQTGEPVKRIILPMGLVFKGEGFYVNDSRPKETTPTPSTPKSSD